MARPVYSAVLGEAVNVSDPFLIGTVPADEVWVIRDVSMTYGSFLGYVRGWVKTNNEDPRLLTVVSSEASLIGVAKNTTSWSGRVVVPSGQEVYVGVEDGDTADFYISGYKLSVP